MRYIAHRHYNGPGAGDRTFNIAPGEAFETIAGFIAAWDAERGTASAVCAIGSDAATRCFARDDDGRGMERGALTHAIAYAPRDAGNGFRFSEEQAALLEEEWGHFLRPLGDTILFNQNFFDAEIQELQALADALGIEPERSSD